MSEDDLEKLISASAKIAKAVEAYPPEVRQQAYDDLMAAFRGSQSSRPVRHAVDSHSGIHHDGGSSTNPSSKGPKKTVKAAAAKKGTTKAGRGRTQQASALRNYDFWPAGKESFPAFAAAKAPRSQKEQNVVALYWFKEIAEEVSVSTPHILAAFRVMKWREASNPANSLQVTASTTSWIDTSDMADLILTHAGRVYVDHDLPPRERARKATKKATK